MKRSTYQPAKRRMRKTGESPYARHNKGEYIYSAEYRSWRSQFKARTPRKEENARANV